MPVLSLRRDKERLAPGRRIIRVETEALMAIESHLLVGDVMRRWPATIRVFLDFRMSCVGCPIAGFHDIEDACREHGADRQSFLTALNSAAG
jgi:hybrid cluster-associated redox disulfide protein